ncbi:MAG: RluA family pseudouridine synthase [Clostridia bacterium]|nr:RluA family pseudouridine synthase [Clostridia bacterium]
MRTLTYIAAEDDDGRLIKRVVRTKLSLSSHQLARAKANGTLLVNGVSVHADYKVKSGETITITLTDDEPDFTVMPEDKPVNILFEDEDLIIIDKEAPLPTQSSPKQPDNTLENRLMHIYRDTPGFVFRPVNRLDKGTSGLMAAAKNAHAQMLLSKQLHTPDFVREYLAVTDGIPNPALGVIDLPIGKADGATVRREVRPDGKSCRTHYETILVNNNRALVHLRLETGRTHQIRVHMSAIGCPVFGDFLYGTEENDILPERFALHSAHMRFIHPLSGKEMIFDSRLPEALKNLIE